MTYPKARYQEEDGEASALITPSGSEPDPIRTSGTKVHYLATVVIPTATSGSTYRQWALQPAERIPTSTEPSPSPSMSLPA